MSGELSFGEAIIHMIEYGFNNNRKVSIQMVGSEEREQVTFRPKLYDGYIESQTSEGGVVIIPLHAIAQVYLHPSEE